MDGRVSTSLVLGYDCNNNCIFCLYGDRKGMRSSEELKKTMDELRKYSNDIMLTGGSAYREDYLEILRYAKGLGFKVHIDHNLRLFANKEFAKKVLEILPDARFSCSLHSPTPEIHDKITRVKGSWKQTVRGIKNIVESGNKNITPVCVICKLNYKLLPEMVSFVSKLGLSRLDFVLVRKEGNAEKIYEKIVPSFREFKNYLFRALSIAEKLNFFVRVTGLPLCAIPKIKFSFELYGRMMEKIIWDVDGIKTDELKGRPLRRVKFRRCKLCKYYFICPGVIEDYVQVHGDKEFYPIKGKKVKTSFEFKKEWLK